MRLTPVYSVCRQHLHGELGVSLHGGLMSRPAGETCGELHSVGIIGNDHLHYFGHRFWLLAPGNAVPAWISPFF